MAVTSIWRIKGVLNKVLLYTTNPKKTEEVEIKGELNYENILNNVLDYTERESATAVKKYVTGINCNYKTAAKEMMAVKEQFNKTGGTVAYHGYQSFDEGEITPDLAHQIGCELAHKLWGKKYQVVVTTHIDKESHIHNHFVIQTVSFVDGIKYHRTASDYNLMRKVSDDLCKKYELSVIKNPRAKSHISYEQYMANKNGEWTKDAIIRRDIDECILASTNVQGFYREMAKRGYHFNFERKYPTIYHPDFERARRLKTLGEDYTPERIAERVLSSHNIAETILPEQDNIAEDFLSDMNENSYKDVYIRFITVVKYVRKNSDTNRDVEKYLADEMMKLDRLIEQQNLLCDNNIDTPEELERFKKECESELREVIDGRKEFRNALRRAVRKGDEWEIGELKSDISLLTQRAEILRRNLKTIERIKVTEPKLEDKINKIKKDNQRKELNDDEFSGRSRTDGAYELTGIRGGR